MSHAELIDSALQCVNRDRLPRTPMEHMDLIAHQIIALTDAKNALLRCGSLRAGLDVVAALIEARGKEFSAALSAACAEEM